MAGGLRYEGRRGENDRKENGRRCESCWVALMMSEGYRKAEQKAHSDERKTKSVVTTSVKMMRSGNGLLLCAGSTSARPSPFINEDELRSSLVQSFTYNVQH